MNDIKTITEIIRYNEAIARKFFEIEKRILSVLNYTDLFDVLLTEIQDKFKMPYAWISLIEKSELSDFVQTLEASEKMRHRLNIIDKATFVELVGSGYRPILVNEDLKPYYRLLPPNRKYFFKSIAIAPISLDGQIIGSLNQADVSMKRFQPGIDTSLLEQLAVKLSLCLSNVTAHEKLRFLAYHDPLTGLLNRRVMESVLAREYSRAQRYPKNLTVVFVDLDDFKTVNDVHGHDRGDDLLRYVARSLGDVSRNTDVVARYAGDEFVMILPETPEDNAVLLMERIQKHLLRHPLCVDNVAIPVSISYGIAAASAPGVKDPQSLLKKADEALYEAKSKRSQDRRPAAATANGDPNVIDLPREK
jgi:diguanylate cyclase (GGDEF)-like protein